MCQRAGLLFAFDQSPKRCLITSATCDSFLCPECSARMLDHWRLRAQMGARKILSQEQRVDFVTITSHEKLKNFDATARVWTHVWSMLYDALKRQNPQLMYFAIPEKHADGRLHLHAIWNAGVTTRWLKDNVRKRGGGYECLAENVWSMYDIVRYVTKYVTKQFGLEVPAHFRRIRVSQNWPEVPKPDTALSALDWSHIHSLAQLNLLVEHCARENLRMIDLRSGSAFDTDDSPYA